MFCSNCGFSMQDGLSACPKCGALTFSGPTGRRRPPAGVTITNGGGQGSVGQGSAGPARGKTVMYSGPQRPNGMGYGQQGMTITFVEDGKVLTEVSLEAGLDTDLRFGSAPDNDVVVSAPSGTVSGHHGIISMHNGICRMFDTKSTNGLYLNGARQQDFRIAVGDIISVGRPARGAKRCVIVVGEAGGHWKMVSLRERTSLCIGRADDNDLVLNDATVSSSHAVMLRDPRGFWTISDRGSTNGTVVDNQFVRQQQPLFAGSTLRLGNVHLVFLDDCLMVLTERRGVEVMATNLVRYRKNGRETRITTDHVSLHIKQGEFVAIVGGSGCGKSTILNELNGSEPADEGSVLLDGIDLYANFQMLKSSIGYVPQQDIVYDELRLEDMLAYAAKLRMQPDTTSEERATRVEEVIDLLELQGVRHNLIAKLSGGQKKRASIAVELLADPRLLFLDEPTSGLDPGIERKLMMSLSDMAHEGRTIILVTHTTLNLHLCDQVVFLGAGGKLCYAGNPMGALPFFGVKDFVEVYPKIDENPAYWEQRFAATPERRRPMPAPKSQTDSSEMGKAKSPGFFRQFFTLSARYARILINDYARLALMVLQAPLLAFLIHLVAADNVFGVCEDTKFYLFALSCAAFWVGIFDSIQEICKENSIFTRECDGGLRVGSYLASKVFVLAVLCLVQTLLLVAVLILTRGTPDHAIINPTFELIMATYLTVLSAMCLGLLVSALFKSPDKALAMAPILIMPQILFSGIAFELNGITEKVSYGINCRWAIEALGTTSDLNDLDLAIYGETITIPAQEDYEVGEIEVTVPASTETVKVDTPMGKQEQEVEIPESTKVIDDITVDIDEDKKTVDASMIKHDVDEMFEYSLEHLLRSWGILLGMSLLCVVVCYVLLALSVRK